MQLRPNIFQAKKNMRKGEERGRCRNLDVQHPKNRGWVLKLWKYVDVVIGSQFMVTSLWTS